MGNEVAETQVMSENSDDNGYTPVSQSQRDVNTNFTEAKPKLLKRLIKNLKKRKHTR